MSEYTLIFCSFFFTDDCEYDSDVDPDFQCKFQHYMKMPENYVLLGIFTLYGYQLVAHLLSS